MLRMQFRRALGHAVPCGGHGWEAAGTTQCVMKWFIIASEFRVPSKPAPGPYNAPPPSGLSRHSSTGLWPLRGSLGEGSFRPIRSPSVAWEMWNQEPFSRGAWGPQPPGDAQGSGEGRAAGLRFWSPCSLGILFWPAIGLLNESKMNPCFWSPWASDLGCVDLQVVLCLGAFVFTGIERDLFWCRSRNQWEQQRVKSCYGHCLIREVVWGAWWGGKLAL